MKTNFSPKNNPRVIIIQKLYGKFFNNDEELTFPKHRFKKFIKDIVSLTNLDKLFQVILKSATYEFMYKPNLSIKIIIKEYLNASNFFLDDGQTKYLNALLDNVGKKLRSSNA